MILRLAAATAALALLAAPALAAPPEGAKLDLIAKDFVRLTLEAGEREPGYVDAYYGPPSGRPPPRPSRARFRPCAPRPTACPPP
jgi:hypothetical protein